MIEKADRLGAITF